jgi:hypothetical protein
MSLMMLLSIEKKEAILANLKQNKLQSFEQEARKLRTMIAEYPFLQDHGEALNKAGKDLRAKLDEITINDIDYEWHNQIANRAEAEAMERLFDLKSRLTEEKERHLILSRYRFDDELQYIDEFLQDQDEEQELGLLLERIGQIDEEEYRRIQALDNRPDLRLKEAKVAYLKLMESRLIKEELEDRMESFTSEERKEARKILEKHIVDKNTYRRFMRAHYLNQKTGELQDIQESFEALGYTFDEEIREDALQYISTGEREYKVAIRVANGKISLAFVRFIPRGKTLGQYEKAKDLEKAQKWCKDFDRIKALMQNRGLSIDELGRTEPTLENIRYEEIDEAEAAETGKAKLSLNTKARK